MRLSVYSKDVRSRISAVLLRRAGWTQVDLGTMNICDNPNHRLIQFKSKTETVVVMEKAVLGIRFEQGKLLGFSK